MSCRFIDGSPGVPLIQRHCAQSREFEGKSHSALRCETCGHVFFEPPDEAALERYYNGVYPRESSSWYNVESDYAKSKVEIRARRILDIARRFGFDKFHRYHEVGCAFGGTVLELNRQGCSVTGTELNSLAVEQGKARGNNLIYSEGDIPFLTRSDMKPNVVYGQHVLEHMPDPVSYLHDLSTLLAPESIVVMFVPNAMALFPTAYSFESYSWFHYPQHLNLFSPKSASCAAKRAGYDVLRIETYNHGLEPDATMRALGEPTKSPLAAAIRDHLVHSGLMEEELVMVLTKSNAPVAQRCKEDIAVATRRGEANRSFETIVREIGEDYLLSSTPSEIAPDPPTDNAATRELAEARKDLRSALERAEQSETILRSIEASTSWRATAAPRRLVGWQKGRGSSRLP